MNTKTKTAQGDSMTSGLDGLKWLVVFVLVGVGAYGNHLYVAQPLLYRVLALVALGLVAVAIALTTEKGRAFSSLMRESRMEIRKVVWPTRPETTQTTLVVLAVVVVMSFVLWGVDSLLSWIVSGVIG